jgi:transcriptional regulator
MNNLYANSKENYQKFVEHIQEHLKFGFDKNVLVNAALRILELRKVNIPERLKTFELAESIDFLIELNIPESFFKLNPKQVVEKLFLFNSENSIKIIYCILILASFKYTHERLKFESSLSAKSDIYLKFILK